MVGLFVGMLVATVGERLLGERVGWPVTGVGFCVGVAEGFGGADTEGELVGL